MKNRVLIISAIAFFLIVNTSYFWMTMLGRGSLAMGVFFALIIIFLVLLIALLWQIYLAIRERAANKPRLVTIGVLLLVLLLTFLKPSGIINFEKFESKNVLVASAEGAANCTTTLKLKDDYKFKETVVCFGVSEVRGDYRIQNDTIYFSNINCSDIVDTCEYYQFAVIEPSKFSINNNPLDLVLYKSSTDTVGYSIPIIENELDKLK